MVRRVMVRRATVGATILAAAAAAGLYAVKLAPAADAGKKPDAAKKPADPAKAAAEAAAKAKANEGVALDPAKAGPDFAVQGEYVGQVEGGQGPDGKPITLAAQVASLGGGQFAGIYYMGGLPGAGWDGTRQFPANGKAKDEAMTEVPFTSADGKAPPGSATWVGGSIKGKMEGIGSFELKKVERKSPTLGAKPPGKAVVLFAGPEDKNVDAWENAHIDERGLLAAGTRTKQKFQNFTLHGEFMLPFKPFGRDQDRANSGFYLQERYEVQVLDSFAQPPVFNGTGAIYRQTPPDMNMCLPPLQWQTYDIDFAAPQFDAAGKKTKNAVITVKLNGVTVHNAREITAKTGAGKPEGAEPGPIQLQGHGNPVFYRNIWVVEK
jgi:hypothetical protein